MFRALVVTLLSTLAFAQGPAPAPPQQLVSNKLWLLPSVPLPQQVPGSQLRISGNPGPQTTFYWVVSRYLVGNSTPAGPFAITNSPNPLSVSNFVIVNITPVTDPGVTYDVLKTFTPAMPTGACACAVATNVTGPVNDQSNSTSAYTVTTFDPNTANLTISNEVQSAGVTHAILRQNGILVCDLSTGCGSMGGVTSVSGTAPIVSSGGSTPALSCPTCITGSGTPGQVPLWSSSSALTNSVIADPGVADSTVGDNSNQTEKFFWQYRPTVCSNTSCKGADLELVWALAANLPSATLRGAFANANISTNIGSGTNTIAAIHGVDTQAINSGGIPGGGTLSVTELTGTYAYASTGGNSGTAATTRQAAVRAITDNANATGLVLPDNRGVDVLSGGTVASGSITNDYGIYVRPPQTAVNLTTHYGLYIDDQTTGVSGTAIGVNVVKDVIKLGSVTFATLPTGANAPNGSTIYCSDCNNTCTAGSSNGKTCFRENGAWVGAAANPAVTAVTGTPPIVSSGGTTPAISCPSCNPTLATAGIGGFFGPGWIGSPAGSNWLGTANIVNTANEFRVVQFTLNQPYTITRFNVQVTGGAASNKFEFGIYNSTCTTNLIDTGPLTITAVPQNLSGTVSSTTLNPGVYYFVQTANTSTNAQVPGVNTIPGGILSEYNHNANRVGTGTGTWSGTALPASCGTITPDNTNTFIALPYFEP